MDLIGTRIVATTMPAGTARSAGCSYGFQPPVAPRTAHPFPRENSRNTSHLSGGSLTRVNTAHP
jgi:hypothetical protein